MRVSPVTTLGMYGKWQGFCPFTFGALFFHSIRPTTDGDRDHDGIPDSQDPHPDSAEVQMSAPTAGTGSVIAPQTTGGGQGDTGGASMGDGGGAGAPGGM